jgi:hypothetical protein
VGPTQTAAYFELTLSTSAGFTIDGSERSSWSIVLSCRYGGYLLWSPRVPSRFSGPLMLYLLPPTNGT